MTSLFGEKALRAGQCVKALSWTGFDNNKDEMPLDTWRTGARGDVT